MHVIWYEMKIAEERRGNKQKKIILWKWELHCRQKNKYQFFHRCSTCVAESFFAYQNIKSCRGIIKWIKIIFFIQEMISYRKIDEIFFLNKIMNEIYEKYTLIHAPTSSADERVFFTLQTCWRIFLFSLSLLMITKKLNEKSKKLSTYQLHNLLQKPKWNMNFVLKAKFSKQNFMPFHRKVKLVLGPISHSVCLLPSPL